VLKVTSALVKTFAKETTVAISSIPIVGWVLAATAALTALGIALYNTFSIKAKSNVAAQFSEDVDTAAEEAKRKLQEIEDKIEDISS
jgi:hypothetical protein